MGGLDQWPECYECNCDIVTEGDAWWMVKPYCPKHNEPIRPAGPLDELGPEEFEEADDDTPTGDFWVA